MSKTHKGPVLAAGIQALERGVLLLEYLCAANGSLRIVDISEGMHINKTTVFRILSTFQQMGYVEQDPETERYRATLKVLSMGNAVLRKVELGSVARPHLLELSRVSGESVHLSVRNKFQVVIIDKVESEAINRASFSVGRSNPCYSTGTGKVLLTHMDPEEKEQFFATVKLETRTPNTIVFEDDLRQELDSILSNGYALDRQENVLGLSCVAAPIWNYTGKVIAGVSVTGPSFRIERNAENLAGVVKEAAAKISRSMGCTLP